MPGPVFLIAQQRSGTNLFRRSLASTPWFIDRDEMFHSRADIGTYWTHRALMIARDPELSIPHLANQNKLFESYLTVFADNPDAFTLVDTKYNSLHNLNPIWQIHGLRPHLITFLAEHRIPVIHLIRQDILATYVSTVVSNDLKLYVTKADHVRQQQTWTINILKMIRYVRELNHDLQRTRNWLKQSVSIPCIELEYESLINSQGNFSRKVLEQLETFLGIPDELHPQVMTKKIINRPFWELIDNFESEVVPALKAHGMGPLLPPRWAGKEAA